MSLQTPHAWSALAAVVLLQVYTIGLIVYSFTLWVVPFMAEFSTGRSPILAAASIAGLVMAILSPVAGYAADRVPARQLMLAGLSIFSAGFFLLSLVDRLWQLWLIYGTLMPIGAAFAGPVACQTFVARTFERRKGLALGISSSGTALGGLVFPPVIALLIEQIGWRATHSVIAIVGFLILAPIVWFAVREPARHPASGEPASPEVLVSSEASILRSAKLWIIVSTFIPLGIVFSSVQFNLAPLANDRGLGLSSAGLAMSTMATSMIVGKIVFGGLADRIDHRLLYWADAAIMVGAVGFMTLTDTVLGLFVAAVFLGVAGGGFYPLVSAIVARSFAPAQFGRALGLCFLFLNAVLLGPFVAAFVRDVTGSYATALQAMLVFLAPACLIIFFLRTRPPPTAVAV